MRRFTSSLRIYYTVKIHRSAANKVRKKRRFRLFSGALRWILTVSQIGEREVNLHIIPHLFRINHFAVRSISKYLIGPEVLMGAAKRNSILALDYPPPSTTSDIDFCMPRPSAREKMHQQSSPQWGNENPDLGRRRRRRRRRRTLPRIRCPRIAPPSQPKAILSRSEGEKKIDMACV